MGAQRVWWSPPGSDRRIASELADFDAKAETALFDGNVLITQEKNVLQGARLFVDRKNGKSRLETRPRRAAGRPHHRDALQGDGKRGAAAKPKSATARDGQRRDGGMLGTFKADPNAPMDIEANTLELIDATKKAVFTGNVKAQQGDMVIRTASSTAHLHRAKSALRAHWRGRRQGERAGAARRSCAWRPGRRC